MPSKEFQTDLTIEVRGEATSGWYLWQDDNSISEIPSQESIIHHIYFLICVRRMLQIKHFQFEELVQFYSFQCGSMSNMPAQHKKNYTHAGKNIANESMHIKHRQEYVEVHTRN